MGTAAAKVSVTSMELPSERQAGQEGLLDHQRRVLLPQRGDHQDVEAGQHLSRAIQSGALQPLDKQRLPHFAGIGEAFRQHMAVFDPGNRYAGIYAWGEGQTPRVVSQPYHPPRARR